MGQIGLQNGLFCFRYYFPCAVRRNSTHRTDRTSDGLRCYSRLQSNKFHASEKDQTSDTCAYAILFPSSTVGQKENSADRTDRTSDGGLKCLFPHWIEEIPRVRTFYQVPPFQRYCLSVCLSVCIDFGADIYSRLCNIRKIYSRSCVFFVLFCFQGGIWTARLLSRTCFVSFCLFFRLGYGWYGYLIARLIPSRQTKWSGLSTVVWIVSRSTRCTKVLNVDHTYRC